MAEQWQREQEAVFPVAAIGGGVKPPPTDESDSRENEQEIAVALQPVAHGQQECRRAGNLGAGVLEHCGELRNHKDHQQAHGQNAGDHEHHRIDHGGDDRLAGSGVAFEELGKVRQQFVQDAAFLTGADDVDVHLAEDVRLLLHGFGKAAALFHFPQQTAHEFAHGGGFGDSFEQAQGAVDGHPGFNEGAQAVGEIEQAGGGNLAPAKAKPGNEPRIFTRLNPDRRQPPTLQDAHHIALGFGFKGAAVGVATGVESLVTERLFAHIALVTRTTSSGVVKPSRSLSSASWRRVRMPSRIACSRISLASAPLAMRWRISSLISISS